MGVTKNETMVDELEEKHTEIEIEREGKKERATKRVRNGRELTERSMR